jgi:hypothetical protein
VADIYENSHSGYRLTTTAVSVLTRVKAGAVTGEFERTALGRLHVTRAADERSGGDLADTVDALLQHRLVRAYKGGRVAICPNEATASCAGRRSPTSGARHGEEDR